MTDTKKEQLSLRMSHRTKTLLRLAAAREHRNASNMLEHLVLEYCEKHGITLDAAAPPTQEKQPSSKDSA